MKGTKTALEKWLKWEILGNELNYAHISFLCWSLTPQYDIDLDMEYLEW